MGWKLEPVNMAILLIKDLHFFYKNIGILSDLHVLILHFCFTAQREITLSMKIEYVHAKGLELYVNFKG